MLTLNERPSQIFWVRLANTHLIVLAIHELQENSSGASPFLMRFLEQYALVLYQSNILIWALVKKLIQAAT